MSFVQKYLETLRKHPLPIWAGISVIGALQLNRIMKKSKEEHDLDGFVVSGYKALPLRALSRWWGRVNETELPEWAKPVVLGTYAKIFKCKMEEAVESDIRKYKCLGDFFRRRLKEGTRPIDRVNGLVSPCDGKVLHFGQVDVDGRLESVKGVQYKIKDFLGFVPPVKPGNVLHYCAFYLAPGDYHGFHAPVDWQVRARNHFEGHLLSVSPKVVRKVPKLFHINERVVYIGDWRLGFFAFGAIGATNVGAIKIPMDATLNTNQKDYQLNSVPKKAQFVDLNLKVGEFIGEFNLGSSVVVIFEAPNNVSFDISPGDSIKMGQKVAVLQ